MRAPALLLLLLYGCACRADEPGLLFYLSGENGTTADVAAAGTAAPNFDYQIARISDGAKGAALRCGDIQRLSWWAPGNIYAQRGTLSFFWRSHYPVGPTEFPIFRVGYADHSSWDMVFLRIDYNGHGFDAFVTDASLSRARVSITVDPFPKSNEWTHLALAWDETRSIRFYVNGKLAARKAAVAVYDAALDQFGPHSRIISPHNVQSDYNFVRGGDIDEIRIYDRMLDDTGIEALAKGDAPASIPPAPGFNRDEWWLRYGWNRTNDPPPYLVDATTNVRKVEIHDAYDLKRWWWKACDGIRETTWPGVYNRSRLPGRNDYFKLPDWDCYVQSGKSITFVMPDEPWNQLEISGTAWGTVSVNDSNLFQRPAGQERTYHRLAAPIAGQKVRFDNAEQEQPIGEFAAYNVSPGVAPAGSTSLVYRLPTTSQPADLVRFINGRHLPGEPRVDVLISNTWDEIDGGLDGIVLELLPLKVTPTHGDLFPMNVQVKDPLWPLRNMCDFSFSVKPGEARTLWLDLRDRILPPGKSLYVAIAGAGPVSLDGATVRLVFKPREAARAEHELDRFTQVRDSYAMFVEEHGHSPKLNLFNRFQADLTDLLRVNPNYYPGRNYAAVELGWPRPPFKQPDPPDGVPLWAFRQVELLKRVKKLVLWYIDNRQVEYGDFGGGISDDVDLANMWPGVALMGCEPDKLTASLHKLLEAAFNNGMFTNGLCTIQTDELHSYEEGIDCLGANLILDYGNPKQLERAMETARGVAGLTGVNGAGHRHIRSSYFSGTKIAEDEPWGYAKGYSYLVLQPGQLLVEYNGNPTQKKLLLELADGLLAHRRGHTLPSAIRFADDKDATATRDFFPWFLFWTAWKWTGERKYLDPIFDRGTTGIMDVNANALDWLGVRKDWGDRILTGETGVSNEARTNDGRGRARSSAFRSSSAAHFQWQLSGNTKYLEDLYGSQIEECDLLEYINTEGSIWIDRVAVPYVDLQRARLGGIALVRNGTFPGHIVSWRFAPPANDQSVAILIPDARPTNFTVIAYNLETNSVRASMTGWNIEPGLWEVNGETNRFERSSSLEFAFAPRATTTLKLRLAKPGTPYWQRPDLGIGHEDVRLNGHELRVRVHSLGSVSSPATTVVVRDRAGKIIASKRLDPLPPPLDLFPKTAELTFTLANVDVGSVEIDPDHQIEEITRLNNVVMLPAAAPSDGSEFP